MKYGTHTKAHDELAAVEAREAGAFERIADLQGHVVALQAMLEECRPWFYDDGSIRGDIRRRIDKMLPPNSSFVGYDKASSADAGAEHDAPVPKVKRAP